MDWDEFVRRARAAGGDGAYLATVGADGRPHVTWVGIGYGDGSLWTATFRSSQKARNLRHQRAVALHWTENPDHLVFARARARLVDDPTEGRRLWAAGVLPYDPSRYWASPDDPELLFVELALERASVSGADPPVPPSVWRRPAA